MTNSQNTQENEWREWALNRVDQLVSTVQELNDEDFDIPCSGTILETKNFIDFMVGEKSLILEVGRPNIWLSQNADFVFEWMRHDAKLEFKFTHENMHVFVKVGEHVFSEVHPHSSPELGGLKKAISMYQHAA